MTDEELVIRLKEGGKEAFDELYDRYKNLAIRNAYLITGNRSDAEDVTQEAFVTSYIHIGELKNPNGYRAWLMQILVRLSYRTAKRSKRELPNEHTEEIREQIQFRSFVNPNSEKDLIQKEEAEKIMAAVDTLPVKQRVVVVLYYYDEMNIEEIARTVKCNPGTVKSRLFNARERLKKLLGNESPAKNAAKEDSGMQKSYCNRTMQVKS